MSQERLVRTIKVLSIIQSGRAHSSSVLAGMLDCSKRTILRDIRLLRAGGINIIWDASQRGYSVAETDRVFLESDVRRLQELGFLFKAALISPLANVAVFREAIDSSIVAMLNRMPSQDSEYANNLLRTVNFADSVPSIPSPKREILAPIFDALARRRRIRVILTPQSSSDPHQTNIAPYQLTANSMDWKLTGRSTWHRKVIDVFLNMIEQVELTDQEFETPRTYLLSNTRAGTAA